jgi:hypothetical protein
MNAKRIEEMKLFIKQLDKFCSDHYFDEVYKYMMDIEKMATYCGTQKEKLVRIFNDIINLED